ncbi:DoxX family protein [Blastopirellula sp. JC732]|uniref:DoxX family protein n=1 Tax=Blastopirellula sediminis TaxID=2894196 RepID=A0A9X1MPN6_9BACT|nr:DoxX family protein [Blastopirellula sediminis]MCC9606968.1 DoxX family protein [Blastopirellula sediminis]MCC9629737.1 DoxX family protein [Blastopirellula sediminis]
MSESETAMEKPKPNMIAVWIGRVISVLAGLAFLAAGVMKLSMALGGELDPEVVKQMEEGGFPVEKLLPLGILLTTCAVLYLIPPTSMLGAILLTGYMGGAICVHWLKGEDFTMQVILPVMAWLGLYLRDQRLWRMLPFRFV